MLYMWVYDSTWKITSKIIHRQLQMHVHPHIHVYPLTHKSVPLWPLLLPSKYKQDILVEKRRIHTTARAFYLNSMTRTTRREEPPMAPAFTSDPEGRQFHQVWLLLDQIEQGITAPETPMHLLLRCSMVSYPGSGLICVIGVFLNNIPGEVT